MNMHLKENNKEDIRKFPFKSYNHVEAEKELSHEQGREAKQNEIIKNMYSQGLTIETIAKCVKISIKKVQKILGLF